MQLSPNATRLLVCSNIVMLGVLSLLLLGGLREGGLSEPSSARELSVERLNIVGPDGKTVMTISNKERIAPPVMEGKAYAVETSPGRSRMAGMVFFNDEGDEMGGLLFNSWKRPDGRYAGIGHLSFDRYRDNQVLSLEYKENAQTVQSGLTIYDPLATGRFKESLDLVEEHGGASPERRREIEESLRGMRERGELGAERVFIGSKNNEAQLTLKDSKGRVRARLVIDESDEAKLEFVDAEGNVIARFPE